MNDLPIEPQHIIMIVVLLISAVSSFMGKGKKKEGYPSEESRRTDMPSPPRGTGDPLGEFKRMIAEAREEAEKANRPKPVTPAPTPAAIPRARQDSTPPPPPVEFVPQVTTAPPLKSSAFPSNADLKRKKRRSATSGDISLDTLLRSPESARKAIILTEVLGKPKGV